MSNNVPNNKYEGACSDPPLKAKMDWIKAATCVQRSIMQDSQLWLKLIAKCHNMTNDPKSSVTTQLMTNMKECYQHALAQPQTITELLMEGKCVDCINFDINKFTSRLEYIKAARIKELVWMSYFRD